MRPEISENNSKRIMIITGESSGDLHGSHLIRAAAEQYPEMSFFGVGGKRMVAAGCQLIFSSDELAVMGVWEVAAQFYGIFRRFKQLKRILQGPEAPDALVLIDFPDFNLRLAKVAKKLGIAVLYYITPKVWAWRKKRAKVIAENTDQLALIFPFEPDIFRPFGVAAEYVGNPLLDEYVNNRPKGDLRARLGIGGEEQVVGIFPGSRKSEITYILDSLVETAKLIHRDKPGAKFLLPVAPSLDADIFHTRLNGCGIPIFILEENIYEVAHACNAVLCVSGTVTLQLALTGTPMAILYKIAPLSYAIGKHLVKVEHVGLTNIIAGREIVREFIQDAASPDAMQDEIIRLLDDDVYTNQMRNNLQEVKLLLGEPGCSGKVAKLVHELVTK